VIRTAKAAAFVAAALPVTALCQMVLPGDLLIELGQGTTMASAIESSKTASAACGSRQAKSACEPGAPTLDQLANEGYKCGSFTEFEWRMASELSDGSAFIDRARTLAKSRELIDCTGKRCLVVVPTVTKERAEPNVETLSVCQIQLVGALVGPPQDCKEIVKIGQNERLIKSIIERSLMICAVGLWNFDAVFANSVHDFDRVRQTVSEVLAAKPFSLSIEREADDVIGTRSFLPSGIFEGWREWITVRVSLDPIGKDVGASIATTILVSKQNTTSRESWTVSSEQQEAAYLDALKKEFEKRGAVIRIRHH